MIWWRYDEVVAAIRGLGVRYWELARDAFGLPIYAVELGRGEPTALVTAGVHGDEPAGVHAAIELIRILRRKELKGRVVVVPCRDPSGFNGIRWLLQQTLDERIWFETPAGLERVLRRYALGMWRFEKVRVYRLPGYLVGIVFPEDPWIGENAVSEYLAQLFRKERRLMEPFIGETLVVPANLPFAEGVGLYGRHFTNVVTERGLRSLNSVFDLPPNLIPPSQYALRQLIDDLQPSLTLDLHEGFGAKFYLFARPQPTEDEWHIIHSMLNALRQHNLPYFTVREMQQELPEGRTYLHDAVIASRPEARTLQSYAAQYGAALTLETGLKAAFSDRMHMHVVASLEALHRMNIVVTS